MKQLFIGMGGIGCRTLAAYHSEHNAIENVRCIYVDTDRFTASSLPPDARFILLPNPQNGPGESREALFLPAELQFMLDDFLSPVDQVQLTFVISSFGRCGARMVYEAAAQLRGEVWLRCPLVSCSMRIIALPPEYFVWLTQHLPRPLVDGSTRALLERRARTVFEDISLFLPFSPTLKADQLHTLLSLPNDQLAALDISSRWSAPAAAIRPPQPAPVRPEPQASASAPATPEDQKRVFISYSSKNTAQAAAVRQTLESAGVSCWMADKSILTGEDYTSRIPDAIRRCDLFLLVLSKEAQESAWVPKELKAALNYHKPIIPFRIDSAPISDSFFFCLIDVQCTDIADNFDLACTDLLKRVHAMLNTHSN